jgi:hypothetical protein
MAGPAAARGADRLPVALLACPVALAAFLLAPPYLEASVGPPQAFTLQEAADLLTPLVVLPLAWCVFDLAGGLGVDGAPSRPSMGAIRVVGPIGTRGIQRTGRESRWEAP